MALSGYIFTNPTSILPYLEQASAGPTSQLARRLAKRIGCHVVAGYPEALEAGHQPPESSAAASVSESSSSSIGQSGEETDTGPSAMKALEGEALGVGYNSAVVVNPDGEVVGNYRKTFRFETDKNWAREGELLIHPKLSGRRDRLTADVSGDGFKYFDLGEPLGRTAIGICMGE